MDLILRSSAALITGFALDILLGDPHGIPHIVRLAGRIISVLEVGLRRVFPHTASGERAGGTFLVCIVMLTCTAAPLLLLSVCYRLLPLAGYISESLLCWQLLAAMSLRGESMKVYYSLNKGDISEARRNVSMIVGRDTSALDSGAITRAAVETVAENTSDGVIAPLFYLMLGGAVLGCTYKAVNTMDSMVGYKNDRYINFGRAAAKADDALNYIPSRLSAILMIAAAFLLGLDGRGAFRVWRRDRRNHASPNSAQTEAVCAGALGVRLAGPASYFGKVYDKPYIGDAVRPIQPQDIILANRLMYTSGVLMLLLAIIFRAACMGVLYAAV